MNKLIFFKIGVIKMAHKCTYRDELTLIDGMLACKVYAKYKDRELDVFYELEDGRRYVRYNLTYGQLSGYLVEFPGEKGRLRYTGGTYTTELYDYEETNFTYNLTCEVVNVSEMLKLKPEYKYLISKIRKEEIPFREFITLLNNWKKNMKIEILLANGFYSLALDKRFNKFTREKQMKIIKEITKFDMTEEQKSNYIMSEYYYCKKRKLPLNDYYYAIKGKYTYGFSNDDIECAKLTRKVLNKYDEETYDDYFNLCKSLDKNFADPYWYMPNNLNKNIRKLQRQLEAINRVKEKNSKYNLNRWKKISRKTYTQIGKYKVYIPYKKEDIVNQAEILHQCLITMSYISRHARNELMLVFIKDSENNPVATASFRNNKLDQFYANEWDRENCKPNEEMKKALNFFVNENYRKLRLTVGV